MKTKLLKNIRKNYKFKFKNSVWYVLRDGQYRTTHTTFEDAFLDILDYKCTYYNRDFDWWWHKIAQKYIVKIQTRKFNKI